MTLESGLTDQSSFLDNSLNIPLFEEAKSGVNLDEIINRVE